MATKDLVAIGLLGPTLDNGFGAARWERWRPTVSLFQQEELLFKRCELLYQPRFTKLARTVAEDIASVSPETAVRENQVAIEDAWDFEQVYEALFSFVRDYPFDLEREEYLVHITTGSHVAQICLFLLTESRWLPGRLVQTAPPKRQGAGSYAVIDLDLSKYDRLASRFEREQRAGLSFLKAGIETRNRAFNRLIEQIEQVAVGSRSPLLLTGPTGAGKTRLARRIYELKRARRQVTGAFVDLNCATLRGDAAMSALFGHVRGAFTGAMRDRPGLLRAADGGLLFLDEIGDLGLDEQAMLLRALEQKSFLPMGSDQEAKSDFQLLAGTSRDLRARVREGLFREDLLARIDTWSFRLPGLAERLEDLEPNLDYELEQHELGAGRRLNLSREARKRFLDFATSPEARWTGNFRDLGSAVTRMATFAPGGRITNEVVEDEIARLRAAWGTGAQAPRLPCDDPRPLAQSDGDGLPAGLGDLDRFDHVQLAEVLRVCRESPSLSEAGRRLFAASRAKKSNPNDADRLRKYLARFGLEWKAVKGAA